MKNLAGCREIPMVLLLRSIDKLKPCSWGNFVYGGLLCVSLVGVGSMYEVCSGVF